MAVRPVKNVTAPDRKKSTVRRCAPEQPLLRKVCGSGACRAGMLHVPVHLYFYTFVKQLSIPILFKFTAKKAFVLCQFTKAPRRHGAGAGGRGQSGAKCLFFVQIGPSARPSPPPPAGPGVPWPPGFFARPGGFFPKMLDRGAGTCYCFNRYGLLQGPSRTFAMNV